MLTFASATRINDVPPEWVYHYYLNLNVNLTGQVVKIRSFINSDTTPSLCLFPKLGIYKWKDFSSGEGGSYIDLVIIKTRHETGQNLSFIDACNKIVTDYNSYVKINGAFKANKIEPWISDYKLSADFEVKEWSDLNDEFWYNRYGITQRKANHFNIYPLKYYRLVKHYSTHTRSYSKIEDDHIYGYFTAEGDLYQIYQPYNKEMKFIKLKHHIQGLDQLKGIHKVLIIGSSLKDIVVVDDLGLNVELIAPPSETTTLTPKELDVLKKIYPFIFTMFDNDRAGILAMKKYKKLYGLDYIFIPYEKDTAEFREKSGKTILRNELTIRINKKIDEKSKISCLWHT